MLRAAEERALQAEIAADTDAAELTDEQLAAMRPAREVLPEPLYAALVRRGGRPKSADPKVSVTIRLDRRVVEVFKATGEGWQTRMNETLSRAAKRLAKTG